MQKAFALIKMGRLNILPGGILAYCLGAAMGYWQRGTFDWYLFGLGLLVTELTNLVAHYADEFADVDTDSLTRRTIFSGGSGVLPSGILTPAWALGAALIFSLLSIGLTAWAVLRGLLTTHALWIVGIGLLGGWFYSMPPVALERRGLGELTNALLGAVFMPLMGYSVQTGRPNSLACLTLLPFFFIVMAGLLGAHWPDRAADAAVGRRSLTGMLGNMAPLAHKLFIFLAYGTTLLLVKWILPGPVVVAIFLTLPAGLWAALAFGRQESPVPSSLAMAIFIAAGAAGWVLSAG
jgi:1,4-dihydroxy-2-naphthoate polyprenyltransferase